MRITSLSGRRPLGWLGIVRLGLVQAAIGAIVMLATSLLNRVMVVEYRSIAALPAGLVAFHYVVQLSRPRWGHGSDRGWRRTPWIIAGMATLALGGVLAARATVMLSGPLAPALALAVLAYALIGGGVGAAGTSLLALLASRTAEARRPAAASLTWIMMIIGIVVTAGVAGRLLEPFSPERLQLVASGVCAAAFLLALAAVAGVEGRAEPEATVEAVPFRVALSAIWADGLTRRFTLFVFMSMLAYATQDLILEPFAGLIFGLTPGQSTQLSGVQHQGVLLGMILVGIAGHGLGRRHVGGGFGRMDSGRGLGLRPWIVFGCLASALALAALAWAAGHARGWPLAPTVFALGFANGVFAVAAIGAMLDLAGRGGPGHEGIRIGLWGAAQALAFGLGGLFGATAVDAGRALIGADASAFAIVFSIEAAMFLAAASIATQLTERRGVQPREALA